MGLPVKIFEKEVHYCVIAHPRKPPGVFSSHTKLDLPDQKTLGSRTGKGVTSPTARPLQVGRPAWAVPGGSARTGPS